MNANRIAKRIVAEEKPIHWVTLAARRVLAGEDFDLVMQDLGKDMGLYDTSRFNAVRRELEARVEQERTARSCSWNHTSRKIKSEREGPAANDRDFFKPPAPEANMTLERFRSIALEVLRNKQAPVPETTRLKYIKTKGAELNMNVDDNWLTGLLNEAANGESERLSRPEPSNTPTAPGPSSET